MKNEFRYSDLEFRQDENGLGVVTGTVIRYGDVATLPWGTEEFKAGAFGDRTDGRPDRQSDALPHTASCTRDGAGLTVTDSKTEMKRFELKSRCPDTTTGTRYGRVELARAHPARSLA